MGVVRNRVRASGVTTLFSGLTLLGAVAGCNADPAFVEQTSVQPPAEVAKRSSSDATAGVGNPEIDAGARRGQNDPTTGEPLASAPGVDPDASVAGGAVAADGGAGAAGGGAGGGVGGSAGGSAGGSDSSGGVRDGRDENPSSGSDGTGDVAANPAPVPAPTAAPAPGNDEPRAGAPVVHQTTQKQGKVDVLWMVDDSGSMAWAQNNLTSKFEAFAKKLSDARVDFRVGVTSSDVCDIDWNTGEPKPNKYCANKDDISSGEKVNGVMVGPAQGRLVVDGSSSKSVLTPGADFVSTFARLAKIGTAGSGMEHGLTAVKMTVEKSKSGVIKNFLRSDAFLSVIVLSDEEDDGVQTWCEDAYGRTTLDAAGQKDLTKCKKGGTSPYLDLFGAIPYAVENNPSTGKPWTDYKFTADSFKAYLDDPNVKGEGKFRVSAITGIRGADGKIDCASNDANGGNGPKESGTNYIKAAQLTGGVVENICAPEWNKILSNIGQNVGELANQIALPAGKVPYPGTLEVFIDGQKWDASKYEYKPQGNFLSFKVIPASGAAIKVTYLETVK